MAKAEVVIRSSKTGERHRNFAEFEISFVNYESQTGIFSIDISKSSEHLRAKILNDSLSVEYQNKNKEPVTIENSRSFPRGFRSDISRYWPYLLSDLQFSLSTLNQRRGNDNLSPEDWENITELAETAEALARSLSNPVEATSAIRTKPLRTYTPGIELRNGEGSHVPFEMAKLSRAKSRDEWRKLKSSLEKYGKSSEMFSEVEIKSFGTSPSDPFQIQFSSEGPKTNIVDLGYGTSQVLPILYMIASAPQRGVFLIQQPEVHLHPKAQAALGTHFVEAYLEEKKQFIIETHSDYIVDRIRTAIASGKLKASDVSILFFERGRLETNLTQIELDPHGTPIDPPDSYRSFFLDEQLRILGVT
jgi:hypothetical protein